MGKRRPTKIRQWLATTSLILALAIASPAKSQTQFVPDSAELKEQAPGIKAGVWRNSTTFGGALTFSDLRLTVLKDSAKLTYSVRVMQKAPAGAELRIDLYAGDAQVGTLDFGVWPQDCISRNNESRDTKLPPDNPDQSATRAKIYFVSRSWTTCEVPKQKDRR